MKAAAIYGANGAGKSNLTKAMAFLDQIVLKGDIELGNNRNYQFKLNSEYAQKPTQFEIELKVEDTYFGYGIVFQNNEILEEWLYELSIEKGEDVLIFNRKLEHNSTLFEVHPKYRKTEKDRLRIDILVEDFLEIDIPFIHFGFFKTDFAEVKLVYRWFMKHFRFLSPNQTHLFLHDFSESSNSIGFVNNILPKLNTGVSKVKMKKERLDELMNEEKYLNITDFFDYQTRENEEFTAFGIVGTHENLMIKKENDTLWAYQLNTEHICNKGTPIQFEIFEESDGTQRLMDLMPIIQWLIEQEGVIIIDEIGRSLHPALLVKLVELIMKTPTKGQIIFTTHESHLLDLNIFRQDEIWFVEKDKSGATQMYPLSDFKPRYDSNIQKGYLNGRFGGIPFLGNLKDLSWTSNDSNYKPTHATKE